MISFKKDNIRFNYRTAALIIHNNRILLHKTDTDDFWALPGGRVEMGEVSSDALIREMREEMNSDIIIERLLIVVENFFEYQKTDNHEIGFYYLVSLPENSNILSMDEFRGYEQDFYLNFKWFSLEDAKQLDLYPEFLKEEISNISPEIKHFVIK